MAVRVQDSIVDPVASEEGGFWSLGGLMGVAGVRSGWVVKAEAAVTWAAVREFKWQGEPEKSVLPMCWWPGKLDGLEKLASILFETEKKASVVFVGIWVIMLDVVLLLLSLKWKLNQYTRAVTVPGAVIVT